MKFISVLLLIIVLNLHKLCSQSVIINEILASNVRDYPEMHDFDDYTDWIEIHNPSSQPFTFNENFITDDLDNPFKWKFPDGFVIESEGYLIIWADDYNDIPNQIYTRPYWPWDQFTTQNLHTNFKLNKTGFPGGKQEVQKLLDKMGPMKNEEKKVLLIFLTTIFCWISRKYIITPFIPNFDDSMIAITSAIVLFIIPSKNHNEPLLKWKEAVKIPWGILILFGGGLSIANGFQTTEMDVWIGTQLSSISITQAVVVVLMVIFDLHSKLFLTKVSL